MKVLLCPISGGKFINQAAGLHHLLKEGFVPDASIGASGGSVVLAIYLYAASSHNKIRVFLGLLDSTMFVESWLNPFPSWMIGPFQGSAYRHSSKFIDFGNKMFTPAILQRHEVWILTYNQTLGKPFLFTNRQPDEARLEPKEAVVQNIEGNIETFCKAVLASASIPAVVPSLEINGDLHADGAVYASTPLVLFTSNFRKKKKLHIVHLTGSDLNTHFHKSEDRESIIDVTTHVAEALNRNSTMRDRLTCLDILESYGKVREIENPTIKEAIEAQKKYKATLTEIYPDVYESLDIATFTAEHSLEIYDRQINNIKCRLWVSE